MNSKLNIINNTYQAGESLEFEARLLSTRASSRTAKATQRNPLSKQQKILMVQTHSTNREKLIQYNHRRVKGRSQIIVKIKSFKKGSRPGVVMHAFSPSTHRGRQISEF